jgi:hypothetical protein
MYTLWWRQYFLATQTSVDMLSNVYLKWSKGFAQLTTIGFGLPVSDEHFDDAWIELVPQNSVERALPHVANCAAGLYSHHQFNLLRPAANAEHWIQCIQGV